MRMHSYGKCSPSLTAGVVAVFSLFLLYSYWNISTYNRELLQKLRTAEEQVIELDKNNAALQGTYDKTMSEKSKLEISLMEEQVAEKDIRKTLSEKEKHIQTLKDQLESEQGDAHQLTQDLKKAEAQVQSKDQETVELHSKLVSLEIQLNELRKDKESLEKSLKQIKSVSAPKVSPVTVGGSGTKGEESLQPAFASDPLGAEQQMNPVSNNAKEERDGNGGGEVGVGVLPVPGSNGGGDDLGVKAEGPIGENLDFAEDDIKAGPAENQKEEDDPVDGAINEHGQKDAGQLGVGPAPPHDKEVVPPHHSWPEENREAAHLHPQDVRNAL